MVTTKQILPIYKYRDILFHNWVNLKNWKRSKVKDLSIDNIASIPNQRATAVAIKKIVVATGRQNGFWNLFYTYPLLLSNIG